MALNSIVSVRIAVKEGAMAWKSISTAESLDSLSDGTSSSSVQKYLPLNASTDYQFGVSFTLSFGPITLTKSTCHGTVMIVSPAP